MPASTPAIRWEIADSLALRRAWVDRAWDFRDLSEPLRDRLAGIGRGGVVHRSVVLHSMEDGVQAGLDGLFVVGRGPLAMLRRDGRRHAARFVSVFSREVVGTWCVPQLLGDAGVDEKPRLPEGGLDVRAPAGSVLLFLPRAGLSGLLDETRAEAPDDHRALVGCLRRMARVERLLPRVSDAFDRSATWRALSQTQVHDLLQGGGVVDLDDQDTLRIPPRAERGDGGGVYVLTHGRAVTTIDSGDPFATAVDPEYHPIVDLMQIDTDVAIRALDDCRFVHIGPRRVEEVLSRSAGLRRRLRRSTSPSGHLADILRRLDREPEVLGFSPATPDSQQPEGATLDVAALVGAVKRSLVRQFRDRCLVVRLLPGLWEREGGLDPIPEDEIWLTWEGRGPAEVDGRWGIKRVGRGEVIDATRLGYLDASERRAWDYVLMDLSRAPARLQFWLHQSLTRWFRIPVEPQHHGDDDRRESVLAELLTREEAVVSVATDVPVRFVRREPPDGLGPDPGTDCGWGPLLAHPRANARLLHDPSAAHVPATSQSVDRLARVATERAVGVALGGGGATGFVHLPVLRALHGAGVPIDYVAGVSFGSVVGAYYCSAQYAGLQRLLDRTGELTRVVFKSVVRPAALERWIDGELGGQSLVDLPIPFYPVATNAEDYTPAIPVLCSVGRAVRASGALPPTFAPLEWEGEGDRRQRVLDGFFVSNVPAETLVECGAALVIAVDPIAEPPEDPREAKPSGLPDRPWMDRLVLAGTRILPARLSDSVRAALQIVHDMSSGSSLRGDVRISPFVSPFDAMLFWRGGAIADRAERYLDAHPEDVRVAAWEWKMLCTGKVESRPAGPEEGAAP